MKFKFGDIKYSYEGELNDYFNSYNKFTELLTRYNMDFLSKMYENTPPNFMSYYSDVNRIFKEFTNIKKANSVYNHDNPDIMPANGHDVYNYVARYGLANYQIQAVLRFDEHLDFERLSRAVRLSVDDQPVFGSRFVEHEPPLWKRLANIDKVEFCSMVEAENQQEVIQHFVESPLDMDNDPMVKVALIRSEQYDTICIKNNHACCDGTGTKEYIQLLSEIYSVLDQDQGLFIPSPHKRSRKDQDRLFNILDIADPEKEWIPGSEITKATWPFPWTQIQSDTAHVLVCRLPEGQLEDMSAFSKSADATINDLLLTAYYRSMAKIGAPVYGEPMEIPVTVDLRRYLPDHKTESIRNFSGSEFTKLLLVQNESFSETLARIVLVMNEIKSNRPGLQSAIGLERLENLAFSETLAYYKMVSQWPCSCPDKCAPVLSTLGFIN